MIHEAPCPVASTLYHAHLRLQCHTFHLTSPTGCLEPGCLECCGRAAGWLELELELEIELEHRSGRPEPPRAGMTCILRALPTVQTVCTGQCANQTW